MHPFRRPLRGPTITIIYTVPKRDFLCIKRFVSCLFSVLGVWIYGERHGLKKNNGLWVWDRDEWWSCYDAVCLGKMVCERFAYFWLVIQFSVVFWGLDLRMQAIFFATYPYILCGKNSAKVYPNGFGFWLERRKLWEKVHLGEIPNYFLLSNRENECLDECNYELAVLLVSFSGPKAKCFLLLLSGLFFRHITQRIFNEGRQQKRAICWHESSCVEKKNANETGKADWTQNMGTFLVAWFLQIWFLSEWERRWD